MDRILGLLIVLASIPAIAFAQQLSADKVPPVVHQAYEAKFSGVRATSNGKSRVITTMRRSSNGMVSKLPPSLILTEGGWRLRSPSRAANCR
jgi:hypothetical protein